MQTNEINTHVQREKDTCTSKFSVFSLFLISFYAVYFILFSFNISHSECGENGKNRKRRISTWKRNAKVAQNDGSLNVCVCCCCYFFWILLLVVTIETTMTTTAAAAVVVTINTTVWLMHASILRSARPLNISFTESVIRPYIVYKCLLAVYLCVLDFFTKYRLYRNGREREPQCVRARTYTSECTLYM